eukprot:RCo004334
MATRRGERKRDVRQNACTPQVPQAAPSPPPPTRKPLPPQEGTNPHILVSLTWHAPSFCRRMLGFSSGGVLIGLRVGHPSLLLLLLLVHPREHVVDAQQHGAGLHCGLQGLQLHHEGLQHAQLADVAHHPLVAINPEEGVACNGVLRPKLRDNLDHAGSAVARQGAGDHLQAHRDGLVHPLLHPHYALALLHQPRGDGHLNRAPAVHHPGVHRKVPRHIHGVHQVALHLVQKVLGGPSEENGASLGFLALLHEHEVLVADLPHRHQPAPCAHVRLLELVRAVHDCSPRGAGQAVVIRLAQAPEGGDVVLHQVVGRDVRKPFFCEHHIGLQLGHVLAQLPHVLLLQLQHELEIGRVLELHVDRVLALLVFQRAVQEHHPGVLDLPLHPGVHRVLIDHNPPQDPALREFAPRDLFHLGVPLDINLLLAGGFVHQGDGLHGVQSKASHQSVHSAHHLGSQAAADHLGHLLTVLYVQGHRKLGHQLHPIVQGTNEALHNLDGVNALLDVPKGHLQHLPGKHDHGGGTIPDLLILRAGQLDHVPS